MPGDDPDFLFALFETQRLLRVYAEREAVRFGVTRAQWAVLAKLERTEGLKQAEVAEMMDLQPITLTRLIDKLCESGLIERRDDIADRRINRLYLTPAARPLLEKLAALRTEITRTALHGLDASDVERLVAHLGIAKNNVRDALSAASPARRRTA